MIQYYPDKTLSSQVGDRSEHEITKRYYSPHSIAYPRQSIFLCDMSMRSFMAIVYIPALATSGAVHFD